MDPVRAQLLSAAVNRYLQRREVEGLAPSLEYLPYDFELVDHHQWRMLGGEMVKDELREATNNLNGWQGALRRWHAWNHAESELGEQEEWDLRVEFVEAVAHQCLLMPSAIRDCIVFVATNAFHQVRLAAESGYRDWLEGDPDEPGQPPKHLNRRKRELRLSRLLAPWPESKQLINMIARIDDAPYRLATRDYRNRSSHSIGPRLGIGYTRTVTRSVLPATELTSRSDGAFTHVQVPAKLSVAYSFGGTPPLKMEDARLANLEQYLRARQTFECYRAILASAISTTAPNPGAI